MLTRICSYVESIEGVFTLYVDDMTISSKNPIDSKKIASKVGKIMQDFGHTLSKNKTKYYSKYDFKYVTGVIISPNHQLLVPNRLSFKIKKELKYVNSIEYSYGKSTSARLNGLLQAA